MLPFGATPTSLRDPAVVWALRELVGSDHLVHAVASSYRTWEELAAAPAAHLSPLLGNRAVQVPATPPVPPRLPRTVRLVSRYQDTFPVGLREAADPPSLLFVTGTLPVEPMLAVVGADSPTMVGAEIARHAGLAAATEGVPLIAPLQVGCSLLAARTAVEAGGRVVVVMSHGFGVTSAQQLFLEKVAGSGGAVITTVNPGERTNAAREDEAARIAVTAASAVVLAEVGLHRAAAAPAAAAAVRAGRYLIVPAPDAPAESGRYIPPTAIGSTLFTSSREWTAEHFGSNTRIAERTLNGLAPADAVVANHLELTTAVRTGCRTGQGR